MSKTQIKQALNVDAPVVGKAVVGGAAIGAGVMSAITLLRMLAAQKRDAKQTKLPSETNNDTIVLTLPKTAAAVEEDCGGTKTVKEVPHTKNWGMMVKRMQMRRGDGTIGQKVAAVVGWPTMTASVLGAAAGSVGGAMLIDKIYAMHRELKLKRELEQAKQEYLDMLGGGAPKTAAAADILNVFTLPTLEKQADAESFGALNYPITSLMLLSLLGAGSTAYLTKKVLDEKLKETQDKGFEPPKLNRIILKSASHDIELDDDSIKAAIVLAVQSHLGEPGPLLDDDVKLALAKAGTSPHLMLKTAQESGIANLIDFMQTNHPDVLSALQTKLTGSQPGPLGWFARQFPGAYKNILSLPGVRGLAANKTVSTLSNVLDPTVKMGAAPIGTMLAAAIGGDIMGPETSDVASAVVDEQERRQRAQQRRLVPGSLRVEAADSKALEYLLQNKEKVLQLVQTLAAAGKL